MYSFFFYTKWSVFTTLRVLFFWFLYFFVLKQKKTGKTNVPHLHIQYFEVIANNLPKETDNVGMQSFFCRVDIHLPSILDLQINKKILGCSVDTCLG